MGRAMTGLAVLSFGGSRLADRGALRLILWSCITFHGSSAVLETYAYIVWLLRAVLMLKRWPFGYFFASTFLFGMMFAELAHFVSPFIEDGTFHYTPGMYTAILPV